MWNLAGPGPEPVFSVLAGGFCQEVLKSAFIIPFKVELSLGAAALSTIQALARKGAWKVLGPSWVGC